jgi:hypothetical protein
MGKLDLIKLTEGDGGSNPPHLGVVNTSHAMTTATSVARVTLGDPKAYFKVKW